MVHLNNPGTDYPEKALNRLNGQTIQSDAEAFAMLEKQTSGILKTLKIGLPGASTEHLGKLLAEAIRDYVNAVASRIRPEDRGDRR